MGTAPFFAAIARKRFPNIKSTVAPSSSQGIKRKKVRCGVLTSSSAPASPPTALATSSGNNRRLGTSRCRR